MTRTATRFLTILIYTGLFTIPFLPLFVAHGFYMPFVTPKAFAFRILIEIIAGAWCILALLSPQYRLRMTPLHWAVILFTGIAILSTLFGVEPSLSFWSNFTRMDGLIGLLHAVLYFFILTAMFDSTLIWERYIHTWVWVSVPIGCIALFRLLEPLETGRIDGTVGNPAFLAGYALIMVFLALLAAQVAHTHKHRLLRAAYIAIASVNAFILFHTQTRSAVLGLIIGIIVTSCILAFRKLTPRALRYSARAVLVLVACISLLFFFARDSALVSQNPTLSRIASISAEDTTVQSRLILAHIAWQGFKDRPILGWGPEQFSKVFTRYYDPRLYDLEPEFDRAHNAFLEWLVAGGVFGFFAYLSLFTLPVVLLVRTFNTANTYATPCARYVDGPTGALLLGLVAAYAVHLLFVFDSLETSSIFFALLAFIVFIATPHHTTHQKHTASSHTTQYNTYLTQLSLVVVLIVVASIWYLNIRPLNTNRALAQAVFDARPYDAFLKENERTYAARETYNAFIRAISGSRLGLHESREQLALFANTLRQLPVDESLQREVFTRAQAELLADIQLTPQYSKPYFLLGTLLSSYGEYERARTVFEDARNFSPAQQEILKEIGITYIASEQYTEALVVMEALYSLHPRSRKAAALYAAALLYTHNREQADKILSREFGSALPYDPLLINAFAFISDFDQVLVMWKTGASERPRDVQIRLSLAAAYARAGNRDAAVQEIDRVISMAPALAVRREEYITDILRLFDASQTTQRR